jgi:hypothetical protein
MWPALSHKIDTFGLQGRHGLREEDGKRDTDTELIVDQFHAKIGQQFFPADDMGP